MLVSALLAGLATWLALPAPATDRVRALAPSGARPTRPSLTPRQWLLLIVPVLCVALFGPVTGAVVALGATPGAIAFVAGLETTAARRRTEALRRQLPLALDLVAAVLRSGRDPGTAFAVVGEVTADPLGTELATVAARLRAGADPAHVWAMLVQHRELASVGRAFRRAAQSGVPVAHMVAQAAADARRRRRAAARERCRAVGVRTAVPLGVCFLPAFFLAGIGPTLIGLFLHLDVLP